jgi:hypothetical protein
MFSTTIILLYTLNLPNISFASGLNISGTTGYLHTRTQPCHSNTETNHFQVRCKNTVSATVGSMEQTSFFPVCAFLIAEAFLAAPILVLSNYTPSVRGTQTTRPQSLGLSLNSPWDKNSASSSIAQMRPRETVVLQAGYILQQDARPSWWSPVPRSVLQPAACPDTWPRITCSCAVAVNGLILEAV